MKIHQFGVAVSLFMHAFSFAAIEFKDKSGITDGERMLVTASPSPAISQPLSFYREYKKTGWLRYHERYLQNNMGDKQNEIEQFFERSLADADGEAVAFYMPYLKNTLTPWRDVVRSGNIRQVDIMLPALCKMRVLPGVSTRGRSLPYQDCSGLAAAMECTEEKMGLQIVRKIIDYYKPTVDFCPEGLLWSCSDRCQSRRRAFIHYGLAKAIEKAVEEGRSLKAIEYLLAEGAYVTQEAMGQAQENKRAPLIAKLTTRQREQENSTSQDLLSEFKCLQPPKAHESCYITDVAWPVMADIRPGWSLLNKNLCSKNG